MKILLSNFFTFLILLFGCGLISCDQNLNARYINEFVVKCNGGYSVAKKLAIQMGFLLHRKMIGFDDFYVFKSRNRINKKMEFHANRLRRSTEVKWMEQQKILKRVKRDLVKKGPFKFMDPLYDQQWYLIRSQNNEAEADMNVIEAWRMGYTGKGVVISILDDGIDYQHEDLKDNYDKLASYDLNSDDDDPLPNFSSNENRHGTRCAGEVSAKANNSKCGVGVAYNSRIGAVRMLDGDVTDRIEAEALSYKQQYIDIYSGSWGPDDNGQRVEGPAKLAKTAFEQGTKYGRNGLGNIYVWASGNGGKTKDSCACDGYASSIHTISISSVSEFNRKPWYLESCASTLASTYSSGNSNEKKILSTDLHNACAMDHTGTSASAPLAAGIIALLIEANRNLTWRDVQYIIVMTANTKPFLKGEFIHNGAYRKFSNWYGYGLMDTGKMVRLGRLWITLPAQHLCKLSKKNQKIYLSDMFKVNMSAESSGCNGFRKVNYIEHVILYLKIEHQRRGDLRVILISPAGTRSEILPSRPNDYEDGPTTFDIWPLMSVQFWGESPVGVWTVEIDNEQSYSRNLKGLWTSFKLNFYGTEKWPVRLKKPETTEPDDWFQKFERLVVENDNDKVELQSKHHVPIRGHTDTSHMEYVENIECDDECFNNTCIGRGPQNCDSCSNYQTHRGICVSKCPPGLYLENGTKICKQCDFSCDECFGPGKYNCSRCHVGDLHDLNTKQCQMSSHDCNKGFYKDGKDCLKCSKNCSICTSSTVCSECDDPFVLTLQSQCASKCHIGSFVDSRRRCRVCHMDCLSCIDRDSSMCTSCNDGWFINSLDNKHFGKCVKDCPYGFFTNHTVGFCYRCHQNCKTCTGPLPDMCTDCTPPMELSETGHTCIDPVSYNCKPDEFKSAIGTCEKCPLLCQTCSENRCTSCPLNKYLFNNSCVNQCPAGNFFSLTLNTCLPCSQYCSSCNNSIFEECADCSLNKNLCNYNCPKDEFWNFTSKGCERCHFSCRTCNGNTDQNCTSCAQEVSLHANKCLKKCPLGLYSLKQETLSWCVPCHQSCHNFCNSENGKCLKCPYGHHLTSSGICERTITCPMSEFWQKNQKICLKCDNLCRSCSQNGICTSCSHNFCLDGFSSKCHRCCMSSSSNTNCSQCLFGRELCAANYPLIMPSLLIFEYPITIIILLALAFILIFLLIMFYFYFDNIVSLFKFHNANNSKSVKYKKLQASISLSDNSDIDSSDEYLASVDRVQFKKSTISSSRSMQLEVTDVEKSDENNEFKSLSKSTALNNFVNGHVNMKS